MPIGEFSYDNSPIGKKKPILGILSIGELVYIGTLGNPEWLVNVLVLGIRYYVTSCMGGLL